MSSAVARPDVDRVMSRLKDFQRRTVDHAFQRMYLDPEPARRFLVADEVGLGKTLVARGLIAKALDHLWDRVGRLDVIYICSNADIARQNVARLNVLGLSDVSLATRLTMIPETLKGLRTNKVNFVSFTPGTSFDLKTATGMYQERVLLYRMLREAWSLGGARPPMNVMQAGMSWQRFRSEIEFAERKEIDADLHRAFCERLEKEAARQSAEGSPTLRQRFAELCGVFARGNSNPAQEHKSARNRLIGDLRRLLASTCIHKLEPDLIILDEFQRFKSLLSANPEDEAAVLAQGLFEYEDDDSQARVLLLSATPYKMYTTPGGAGDDDHYADFVATLAFLQNDAAETARVRTALDEYRRLLMSRDPDRGERRKAVKAELEGSLRRVIARTERLAVTANRDGMLEQRTAAVDGPRVRSIRNYQTMQRIARELGQPDTVEYWKAAPYLLNFMLDYKLKSRFTEQVQDDGEAIAPLIAADDHVVAPGELLRGKAPLDPPHARLRWLLDDTVGRGLWKLLWMPPAFPYYQLGEPFASLAEQGVTKRLVFSAWRVVPRAIAALLSYEAERRMLEPVSAEYPSLDAAREKVSEPLKFSGSDGRLTGMSALGILYPSFALASLADPLDPYYRRAGGHLPTCDELLAAIQRRLEPLVAELVRARGSESGPADESWYWAAPMLLDRAVDAAAADAWLARPDAARQWIVGADEAESDREDEYRWWVAHVRRAVEVVTGGERLGRAPDDLLEIVSTIALASPGVAALRSVSRVTGGESAQRRDFVRDAAGAIAWSLRNLFNLPESTALIRALYPRDAYWLAVVEYCAAGGLQAVLDEYQHVLPEFVGFVGDDAERIAPRVAEEVRNALSLRTAPVPTDEIRVTGDARVELSRKRMRSRFAVRFGESEADDGEERSRQGQLRSAFNSPFWPFVLATTSVGQEGLDFHQYCHAVVHWNLPSNPVDLEQREGRVHRFKGHAVRKNVAHRYGPMLLQNVEGGEDDPWLELFDLARDGRPAGSSDIVPYWVFPLEGGAVIERHVPNLPLSRDVEQLAALRRTLAVYRMVFGQPRQEELLEYLLSQMSLEQAREQLDGLRIDLEPASTGIAP